MTETQSTTGLVELKGCPICGGKATVNTRGRAEGVVCAQRDHRIQTYGRDGSAIAAWNTRPTDPTIAELVAALEGLVTRIDDAWPELGRLPPMIAAKTALTKSRSAL